MNRYEESNYNNLQNNLNMSIISYESERIKAQKSGNVEKAVFYEKKRQEIEEIRDKIAENELLDEESILKIKDLLEKENLKVKSFGKMMKIIILTTIAIGLLAFVKTSDIEDSILIAGIYLIIAYTMGKIIINNMNYNKDKNSVNDTNDPIQKS